MKFTKEEIKELVQTIPLKVYPSVQKKIAKRKIDRRDVDHCRKHGTVEDYYYTKDGIKVEMSLGSKKGKKRQPLIFVFLIQYDLQLQHLMTGYRKGVSNQDD